MNDGIVTAEEICGLKLNGTWIVALSACNTGSGEARAGEEVKRLRRGQRRDHCPNAAFKSGNAPLAPAETQRNWLLRLRKERGLLQAVRLAGPFIMSSEEK